VETLIEVTILTLIEELVDGMIHFTTLSTTLIHLEAHSLTILLVDHTDMLDMEVSTAGIDGILGVEITGVEMDIMALDTVVETI